MFIEGIVVTTSRPPKLDYFNILSSSDIQEPIDSHPISDLFNGNIFHAAPESGKSPTTSDTIIDSSFFRFIHISNNKNKFFNSLILHWKIYYELDGI